MVLRLCFEQSVGWRRAPGSQAQGESMMNKEADIPLDRLEAFTKALCADADTETRLFELEGQTFVFKRARTKSYANTRACLAALGCWLAFGERVSPSLLLTGGISQEAARLRELARAGRRVPKVLLQNEVCLVLSYVGQSFDEIVEHLSRAEKLALFARIADDLADWHRHGCWHGGAQLRNVTEQPDGLCRIDFEERHGYALSVAATRAYDLFLYFGDALSHLDAEDVLSEGVGLMQRYLDQLADPALLAMLRRLRRLLAPIVWADTHLPRLTRKRDTQRIARFVRVLQEVL